MSKITPSIELLDQIKFEYDTLRKEIEAAKAWEYRLLVGGLVGFPAAFEWASKSQQDAELSVIVLLLPLAVLVLSLLVAFVRRSAMRCGSYIHDVLEPHFPLNGWESWLEESRTHRWPERLLACAFLAIILFYYLFAAVIAIPYAHRHLNMIGLSVSAALYLAGFVATGILAWTPTSTRQRKLNFIVSEDWPETADEVK